MSDNNHKVWCLANDWNGSKPCNCAASSLAAPACSPAPVPSDDEHALAAKVLDALYAAKISLDTTKPSVVVTVIATQLRGRVRGNARHEPPPIKTL